MRTLWLSILVLGTACSRPEPAPADMDGALHYLWDGMDAGEDADMAQAAINLDAELDRLIAEENAKIPYDGAQSRLTIEQVADLEFEVDTPDPSVGGPFFVANELACSTAEIERVFTALNQDELHPGSYDRYERTYTTDADAFYAGDTNVLSYTVELEATYGFPVNYTFTEFLQGRVRRVDGGEFGDVVLARTHMVRPSEDDDDNKSFDQDYQLDIWWERPSDDGPKIMHIWTVWRVIDLGSLGDQDNRAVIGTQINSAIGRVKDIDALCAVLRDTGEVRPAE